MSKITHLYIKTHNITGLKYFGKTTSKDPFKYNGSGIYWQRHLKIHGKDISTKIVASFDESQKEEMVEFALFFSDFFDIVESKEWANLIPENGIEGFPIGMKFKEGSKSGNKNSFYNKTHSIETKEKISNSRKGKCLGEKNPKYGRNKGSDNPMYGKTGAATGRRWITDGSITLYPIIGENFILPDNFKFGRAV